MATTIGPFRPDPKGTYSGATEYSLLDWVTDSGNSYLYINETPSTGTALSSGTHWLMIAAKGNQDIVDAAESARDLASGYAATASTKADAAEAARDLAEGYRDDSAGYASLFTDVHINVKSYGATGDGVTDDTDAINAAIDAIEVGQTLFFPAGTYNVDETISITTPINVQMDGTLSYTGSAAVPCLSIGSAGVYISNVQLALRATRATPSDWTDEGSIAIKLINIYQSDINILSAQRHTIGLQCIGDTKGFAYNTVKLFLIYENKIGVDLTNANSGWCNENLFIGGRFGQTSTTNRTSDRYGVRVTSADGSYLNNNNNVFLKPSFELGASALQAPATEAIPVLIEHGASNSFLKARNENNSTTTIRALNASSFNIMTTGYGDCNADDQSSYSSTSTMGIREELTLKIKRLIFKADSLQKSSGCYNGTTQIHVPGLMQVAASGGAILKAYTWVTIENTYINVTNGIGVFVKTNRCKRFIVSKDAETGYGGRVYFRCYNSAGNALTSSDAGHPYVKSVPGSGINYSTNYGGAYVTTVDSNFDIYFEVGADVDYILLILAKGTNNLRIRSFAVYAENYDCSTWVNYEQIIPGANIGTAAPTAGTWEVGRRVINDAPAIGQPKAWICTVAGTPGTWVSEGNL